MSKPIRRIPTPDIPDFDLDPGTREEAGFSPTEARQSAAPAPGALSSAAERIGRSLGATVSTVRGLPRATSSRLVLVKGHGGQRASAAEQLKNIRELARKRAAEQWQRARARATRYARERPLHVIVGAAGLAFLLGIGLRAWRRNHD